MGKTSGLASIRRRTSDSIGHLPLSLKIGIPLTIVSVLVAGALALTGALSASSSIDRHAVANAAGLAKFVDSYVNFAQTPGNPAQAHPKESADQFVRALATTDPSVIGIRIFQATVGAPTALSSSPGTRSGLPSDAALIQAERGGVVNRTESIDGQPTLVYLAPLGAAGRGVVEIDYSLAARTAAVDRIWRETALVTGIGLVVELFLFWLVFRIIVLRRLRRIASVVHGLTGDDLQQQALEPGGAPGLDDLAIVGSHIDQMVASLQRRAHQDGVLFDLGLRAAQANDLNSLLKETGQAVQGLMPSAVLVVNQIVGEESDLYVRTYASSDPEHDFLPSTKLSNSSVLSYIVQSRKDVFYEDGNGEDRFDTSRIEEQGVRSGLGVIIPGEQRPFGILAAYSKEQHAFLAGDLVFVRSLAALIGATAARLRADRDREASESRMHATFTSSPAGILFVDPKTGAILDANPAFCNALGYSAAELQERTVLDILHADDVDLAATEMAGVFDPAIESQMSLEGMVPESALFEQRFIARDGSVVWMQLSAGVVRDSSGEPAYFQSTCIDVTERKAAETTLQSTLSLLRRTGEDRQRLMASLVQAQQEQNKAAGELHHHVTQVLAGSALELERLAGSDLDAATAERLEASRAAMSKALEELRAATDRRTVASGAAAERAV
ncbi:MAG TPA: PAS domain S-box protein [Candidatus Solibacter sp.]|jgi:PAS domain S-box-containing protein|nr:PAS domain S-box protein [Candidatus Solibacter sp.]